MKFFIALMLIAMIRSTVGQSVQFGLLICEQGPIFFRQSATPGVSFQLEPPSRSQCTAGKVVCNADFGFFAGHRGLGMCSVSRDCVGTQQVCLRKFQNGGNTIEGCCKAGFEAWALSGRQEISGTQFPAPRNQALLAAARRAPAEDIDN